MRTGEKKARTVSKFTGRERKKNKEINRPRCSRGTGNKNKFQSTQPVTPLLQIYRVAGVSLTRGGNAFRRRFRSNGQGFCFPELVGKKEFGLLFMLLVIKARKRDMRKINRIKKTREMNVRY